LVLTSLFEKCRATFGAQLNGVGENLSFLVGFLAHQANPAISISFSCTNAPFAYQSGQIFLGIIDRDSGR